MSEINNINNYVILITGCAGFIGGAMTLRLIETTFVRIIGIDNMNDYYDVNLKEYRLERIRKKDKKNKFMFIKADIADKQKMLDIFKIYKPDIVIHLAAQAGVRYSIDEPDVYVQSNIVGFVNVLEACRYNKEKLNCPIKRLLFASSSSVYGNNEKTPYSEDDNTDHPVSLYAATKKADEVIAYAYANLYKIPMTGMRFFTVYGPAGRPDMAYYKFAEKLIVGETIDLYNEGKNKRDFTYIDDVVDAIEKMVFCIPNNAEDNDLYRIYNIGNNHPVDTITFVEILFDVLRKTGLIPKKNDLSDCLKYCEAAQGDVETTYADITRIGDEMGVRPTTDIKIGLLKFAEWYVGYKNVNEK